jgi:gliding motility-associated-like protein
VNKTIGYNNRIICKKDTVTLTANGADAFYWWSLNKTDTLSKDSILKLQVDSNFRIYLLSTNGIDSLDIIAINPPNRVLPKDTLLCETNSITINAQNNFAYYLWNTGDTTSFITISYAGEYFVKTQTGSCNRTDTVEVSSCPPTLFVPNAFTPNNDGDNDVFFAKGVQITDFTMVIFNRWGEQIFETNDINIGWDGTFKNNQCTADSYVWQVTYRLKNETSNRTERGTVTLLK